MNDVMRLHRLKNDVINSNSPPVYVISYKINKININLNFSNEL